MKERQAPCFDGGGRAGFLQCALSAALFLSAHAFAAVGVAIGHHTWAEDGIPVIGPNEQVAVFTCTGQMTGPSAMSCAVDKCLAHFKLPKSAEITNIANTVLVGGKCAP